MRLFSYKLTHDTGFAPNPFGETLTLATCKPGIRKSKRKGDWIAGFTSKQLTAGRDHVGSERLIYLMKVGEKLRFRDYFIDERFQDKIPDMSAKDTKAKAGDNIYQPLHTDALALLDFKQLDNPNHPPPHNKKHDLSGEYVLIADEFYYFGKSALQLPGDIRPKVPPGMSRYGFLTDVAKAEKFIEYIRRKYKPGIHGHPHCWPDAESEA